MQNNLLAVFYMLLLLGIAILVNTTLGVVIANKKLKFNWSKFLKGIGKAFLITVSVLLFCLSLELMPIVLNKVGIVIPNDLITVLEVIMMCLTAYKKYTLDCIEKFKEILGGNE